MYAYNRMGDRLLTCYAVPKLRRHKHNNQQRTLNIPLLRVDNSWFSQMESGSLMFMHFNLCNLQIYGPSSWKRSSKCPKGIFNFCPAKTVVCVLDISLMNAKVLVGSLLNQRSSIRKQIKKHSYIHRKDSSLGDIWYGHFILSSIPLESLLHRIKHFLMLAIFLALSACF